MSSLTESAYYTRKAINWSILIVIGYFILRAIGGILVLLYFIIFPVKPPAPTHAFGKLPAILFPPTQATQERPQFKLETIEGTVPPASGSAVVYTMPKRAPNLLALDNAKTFAGKLMFDTTPIQESKNVYRFMDPNYKFRRLRFDIVNNIFSVRYDFEKELDLFKDRNENELDNSLIRAKNKLAEFGLYESDLQNGYTRLTYLRINNDQLQQTTSLSKAEAIRIDFFRKPINNLDILTPIPDEAPVSFIYSGNKQSNKNLLLWSYIYWPIDYSSTATYGLKSSHIAWEELINGGGYIARYSQVNPKLATVRSVRLAYYDSFEPQNYLQPIFVFEGDHGFMAYVPAVAQPWTEEAIGTPTPTPKK